MALELPFAINLNFPLYAVAIISAFLMTTFNMFGKSILMPKQKSDETMIRFLIMSMQIIFISIILIALFYMFGLVFSAISMEIVAFIGYIILFISMMGIFFFSLSLLILLHSMLPVNIFNENFKSKENGKNEKRRENKSS
ncbi:MAG: hypothetical protein CVT89_03875 [Candidatus Altiarchaeales archaeon HGW-Altiarchaeales-2]|nr:MAG: hypothetical protein CVT89_03875 [Candidatus Altiarchaeales archaeon HGW-Altiarchaeales-2]